MSAASRREQIVKIFLSENKVKVGELAKALHVTTETIRKDLIVLEQEGLIKRNNGSAEVMHELTETDFAQKSQACVEQKRAIAAYAAGLIPENATIFLDSGSTLYHLARQLIIRKDLTVITNSLAIASMLLANRVRTILIGGELRPASGAAAGQLAVDTLRRLRADLAFLGTSGFADADGPCVENFPEAGVKAQAIASAEKAILLADSSKAAARAMVNFGQWSEFDLVISDKALPPAAARAIKAETDLKLVAVPQ